MINMEQKLLTLFMDALGKIANGKITPFFSIPDYAASVLKQADEIAHPERGLIHLDTDSNSTSYEFLTCKNFVERFAKKESDVLLTVLSEYDDEKGKKQVLYQLTLKPKVATAEAVDWLDANTNNFTSDEQGIHLFFSIEQTTGTETAYLTKGA